MKNKINLFGIIALVAVIVFSMAACGGDDNGGVTPPPTPPVPQTVTYVSEDSNGNIYTLEITENTGRSARYTAKGGDSFTFKVELFSNGVYSVALTYSGTVGSVDNSGANVEIKIAVNSKELTITIAGTAMTVISGEIVNAVGQEVVETPDSLEPVTEAENWWSWNRPESTATIAHSVNKDDVCTITVSGTAMADADKWKAMAGYSFNAKANTAYVYKFEAWTLSGERDLLLQYYDNGVDTWLYSHIMLTTERKTHTVMGSLLPKDFDTLQFHCADQTGTFYVKVLSVIALDDLPAADRWIFFDVDSEATVTLTHSVGIVNNITDVATITIGGTAQPEHNWYARALYYHAPKEGASYDYTFEAWTQSGNRTVWVPYYNDYPDFELRLGKNITLTPTRTTHTIRGERIPITTKGGIHGPEFNCADQTGTFYVKILSITEHNVADRWLSWAYDGNIGGGKSSTATISHSVAADGVCTINVGGTAEPEDGWKATAQYSYFAEADAAYRYTFEAWTQSGTRNDFWVQYYEDQDDQVWLGEGINITTQRKTFTIDGESLPKGGERPLAFQCGKQTGRLYVRIISITSYWL